MPLTILENFRKEEHLTGRKKFEELIKTGFSFYIFPFRVILTLAEHPESLSDNEPDKSNPSSKAPKRKNIFPAHLGISVAKKKFSSSVDRNRIKRLIREAYRKIKEEEFYPKLKEKKIICDLLLIYTHNKLPEYKVIDQKIRLVLKKIEREYVSTH